jgi:hypothetical protein
MIACMCPECGHRYKIAEDLAGKSVLCPECQTRFKPKAVSPARARRDEDDDQDRDDSRQRRSDDDDGLDGEQASKAKGIPAAAWIVGGAALSVVALVGFAVVVAVAMMSANPAPPAVVHKSPAVQDAAPQRLVPAPDMALAALPGAAARGADEA